MSKTKVRNKYAIDAHFRNSGGPQKEKKQYKREKITKNQLNQLVEEEQEIEEEIQCHIYNLEQRYEERN